MFETITDEYPQIDAKISGHPNFENAMSNFLNNEADRTNAIETESVDCLTIADDTDFNIPN